LTPSAVSAWSRAELREFLYPSTATTYPVVTDPALVKALLERTTRADADDDPLEVPDMVGPAREVADVCTLLRRVPLDSAGLLECYRLVTERLVPGARTHRPGTLKPTWPGLVWVLGAFAEHPACTLETLADFPLRDARRILGYANAAGRTLLQDGLGGTEDDLRDVFEAFADTRADATELSAVLDEIDRVCDTTRPHWSALLAYELRRLYLHAIDTAAPAPGTFARFAKPATASLARVFATADNDALDALAAVIDQDASAPLEDLAAACVAIITS
jgi:hypothetical protein